VGCEIGEAKPRTPLEMALNRPGFSGGSRP
jgi:hypothetical protein